LLGKPEDFAGKGKPEALKHQLSDMRCVLTNVCIDQFRSQYLLGIKASSLHEIKQNRGLICRETGFTTPYQTFDIAIIFERSPKKHPCFWLYSAV
jgi:hypothetical protein